MKKAFQYNHKGPIKNWHEGLMLGNGHMGALIYGEENVVFSLDLIDLWDNRLTDEMKEKGFNYQNMVETLKTDWDEYLRLFDKCYNHPYPTKLNAGSIIFKQAINKSDKFELDIKKAEANIYLEDNTINTYLDANNDVLTIFFGKNINYHFKMPEYLSREENGLAYPKSKEYITDNGRFIVQETKCGFSYAIVVLEKAKSLYITIVQSNSIMEEVQNAFKMLEMYSLKVNENRENHYSYWKNFFNHSSLTTNELLLDRSYNFGRYFLACNSKNSYPMSLEGVWTRNDGNLPPWKGDYHLDINLQMSYESYMRTGDFVEGKALVDYLWNNRSKFRSLAKRFCKSEGYFIPGVMTQDCTPLGGWPMYALNPCNGIWISTAFDNYYRYTGKQSFLKNRAFPFFVNLEKCISSLLIKKDGHLQLEFSSSPEINDCLPESIFKNQSNFELSMLHYLYKTLIDYSSILGLDNSYYKKQKSLLADFYRNDNGEMMISKDLEFDVSHRHFSHILCHKNLELFDPIKDKDQIIRDFNRLEKFGHDQWVGFSFTEASSLASYVGLGEEAYKLVYAFADGFINDNCFHMNMDYKHKGYSTIQSYAFTLEANIGYVRALTDMMLRTSGGIITIFPSIPQKFREKGVSFAKLRTYNNHKVSGKYKDNKLSFDIKLSKPETIKLYNNIKKDLELVVDGTTVLFHNSLNQIIEVKATKLISYKD